MGGNSTFEVIPSDAEHPEGGGVNAEADPNLPDDLQPDPLQEPDDDTPLPQDEVGQGATDAQGVTTAPDPILPDQDTSVDGDDAGDDHTDDD